MNEKPKALSEFTQIEQEAIISELNKLLERHKTESYSIFYYNTNYHKENMSKNIFFYVPSVNKFFYLPTDYLLPDLNYHYPNESVGDRLLNYDKNTIFSIDELHDIKHGYYGYFSDKTILYKEVIQKFVLNNEYSGIREYEEFVNNEKNQENRYQYGWTFSNASLKELLLGYALTYIKYPQIEKMIKTGFKKMVISWTMNPTQLYLRNFKNGNNMNEITKLPKYAWQLLINEGIADVNMWNEYRVWIQKDDLSKDQLSTILNLNIRDTSTIKSIRTILNAEFDGKKLYTLDSLLNYLSRVDMYQAIGVNDALTILRDYIKMSLECSVKPITDSNSLKREHDVIMRQHNIYLRDKREEFQNACGELFKERGKELSKYEYEQNELIVVAPKEVHDLIVEGNQNHNCVGSYIERFAKGTSNIFFIRKKESPEDSYITIEVNSDFTKIKQAFYSSNREITKESDWVFINKWLEHNRDVSKDKNINHEEKDITDDMF